VIQEAYIQGIFDALGGRAGQGDAWKGSQEPGLALCGEIGRAGADLLHARSSEWPYLAGCHLCPKPARSSHRLGRVIVGRRRQHRRPREVAGDDGRQQRGRAVWKRVPAVSRPPRSCAASKLSSPTPRGLKARHHQVLGATGSAAGALHAQRHAHAGKTQRDVSAWIGPVCTRRCRIRPQAMAAGRRPGAAPVSKLAALMDDAETDVLAYMASLPSIGPRSTAQPARTPQCRDQAAQRGGRHLPNEPP